MIRNVANDILDDMVGCGGCAVTWEKVRVQESCGICGIISSALGEIRTGNTHPQSKQMPRIEVQKQERRGLWC